LPAALPSAFEGYAPESRLLQVFCLSTPLRTLVPRHPKNSTAYAAELVYHCMGFREWFSHLCRVPLQQKGWKTLVYPSGPQELLAWKQKGVEIPELVWTVPRDSITSVLILSSKS